MKMVSRLIVRTVLALIITAMAVALWWTWTANFQNIAQRVALTLIEGGVLVAALSLLLESFLSFEEISVKRGSWRYFLSGLFMFDEDMTPSINTWTCEMFGARSFVLSMFSLITAAFLTVLFQLARSVVLFLFNPHVPAINWNEALLVVGMFAVTIPLALLVFWGLTLIYNKIHNTTIKFIVFVLYGSVVFGLLMGVMNVIQPIENTPIYQIMLIATGVALGLVSIVGVIFGLGYAIYKVAGRVGQRFPVFQTVWNQFCPVRTVRFK